MTVFNQFRELCYLYLDDARDMITYRLTTRPRIEYEVPFKEVRKKFRHFDQMHRVALNVTVEDPCLVACYLADCEKNMANHKRSDRYIFMQQADVIPWCDWVSTRFDSKSAPGHPMPIMANGQFAHMLLREWEYNHPGITPLFESLTALNLDGFECTALLKQQIPLLGTQYATSPTSVDAALGSDIVFD